MISVLIPTKNEEHDLPGCLESVAWSDDIHVYDSGSSDATAAVARRAGANFFARVPINSQELFGGNESEHRNWALANLRFKYEWVLHLDADERIAPELVKSIQHAARDPKDKVAFRVTRRDFWGNRWLKHVTASPFNIRLFRPEKMRYERLVNPVSIPLGPVGDLVGYFDHYPFNKGVRHWLAKHNSYSSLEAKQIIQDFAAARQFRLKDFFLTKDRNVRRFYQKRLFYRLPARPVIKFLLLYLGKRGFLDGSAGFRYAVLQSFYEYMIVLKTKELVKKSAATVSVS
ncbi:MAG: glycosyltransferase family 2 protein [Candidatus Acidiferrales bacterium]|jgi:glycosyltransferase involved in cell wall biosynthesis